MADFSAENLKSLPDCDFAHIDADGVRHLPLADAAHVRNAASRFNQTQFESEEAKRAAWRKIEEAARNHGVRLSKKLGDDGQLVDKAAASASAGAAPLPGPFLGQEEGTAKSDWIELIPAGQFGMRDGRGPFTNRDPIAVIAASKALKLEAGLPIDYDHAIDKAAPEGRPAPAAGWIKDLEVRAGAIWGRVEWTPAAAAAVKNKEYRYISPVFDYERTPEDAAAKRQRGVVMRLKRAALTNDPAMFNTAIACSEVQVRAARIVADDSLVNTAVASSEVLMAARDKDKNQRTLSETVATLEEAFPDLPPEKIMQLACDALGLKSGGSGGNADDDAPPPTAPADAGPYGDGDPEEVTAQRHANAAAARQSAGGAETDEAKAAREQCEADEMAAAKTAKEKRMSRASASATDTALAALNTQNTALAAQVQTLLSERATEKAEGKVTAAMKAGKLAPALKEWGLALCTKDPDAFDKFIGSAPTIIASGADSATAIGVPPAFDGTAASLTREQLAICSMHNLDPAEFARQHAARAAKPSAIIVELSAIPKPRVAQAA